MVRRNKLLAIEGIDGSGKRTQIELLSRALTARGVGHARFSFPRYDSFSGGLVARFLNGDFGPLDAVDPHFSALLFAGDRLEAKCELLEALEKGLTVLADRYIGSNLAHQTARVAPKGRKAFLAWLSELEYKVYGLPREQLVVYLRVPPQVAHRLVGEKLPRGYTARRRDLQEADLRHLKQAAQVYERLARGPNWITVESWDAKAGKLRAPEEIHAGLIQAIEARAPFLLRRQRHRK